MGWMQRLFTSPEPPKELVDSIARVEQLSHDLRQVVEQAKRERATKDRQQELRRNG